jgi:hypothetical protein
VPECTDTDEDDDVEFDATANVTPIKKASSEPLFVSK